MSNCILATGTITLAMKAKKILLANAIPAETVKLSSLRNGCLYGVQFPCAQVKNAQRLLQTNSIPFEETLG